MMMTLFNLGDARVRVHRLCTPAAGSPQALEVQQMLSARVSPLRAGYLLLPRSHWRRHRRRRLLQHRAVAEACLGRKLRRGEVVHHIRPDKADNRPENLAVCSRKVHYFIHRRHRSAHRMPGERQRLVACACGCGRKLQLFGARGRRRTCLRNHRTFETPTLFSKYRLAWRRFRERHGIPRHVPPRDLLDRFPEARELRATWPSHVRTCMVSAGALSRNGRCCGSVKL
jgi:hypothetical protein